MGAGADEGIGVERRKIVGRKGFALVNLLDGPLWKEV